MYPSAYFSSSPFPISSYPMQSNPSNQSNEQTEKYCKILTHNTNAMNFCQQKPCYMVNEKAPWIKNRVGWYDNAAFTINNRIVSNTNDFEKLHYSSYTPFHYDPTWQDYRIIKRKF